MGVTRFTKVEVRNYESN